MVYLDLVCTKCQESRYRSKIEVGPETKATPDLFLPLGEQPIPETYKESPLCYVCDSKLVPMPAPKEVKSKLSKEEAKMLREQELVKRQYVEEELPPTNLTTLFECKPDETNLVATVLGHGRILIQTSKRIAVLTLEA